MCIYYSFDIGEVAIAYLIFHAQDVYKIKIEMMIQGAQWLAVTIAGLFYASADRPEQRSFPSASLVMIGLVLTLFISNVFPLALSIQFDWNKGAEGSYQHFLSLMKSVQFRCALLSLASIT